MNAVTEGFAHAFRWKRHLPMYLQTEAAECGLACIAMVAGFFGSQSDLLSLRQRSSISLKGANLKQLMKIAHAEQLHCRALRVEPEALSQLDAPCILHWDMNHFVVLRSATKKKIVVHDPAMGMRELTPEQVGRHFTGVVLELAPMESFAPKEERRRLSIISLVGRIRGLGIALLHLFGIAVALELIALAMPLFLQTVVDQAVVAGDHGLIGVLGVGFLLLAFIQVALNAARSWAIIYLSAVINIQWVSNVFRHMVRLPVEYFEKRHLGDVLSRFGSISAIQQILTTGAAEVLLDGLMAALALVMMAVYSIALTSVAVAALAVHSVVRYLVFRKSRELIAEQIVCSAKQQSHLIETVRGMTTIRLFSCEDQRQHRWQDLSVATTNRSVRVQRLSLLARSTTMLLLAIEHVVIVWLGALLVLNGAFSVGMLFAFVSFKEQFSSRLSAFSDKAVEMGMLRLHAERLADVLLAAPERVDVDVAAEPVQAKSLRLENVCFRYGDTEDDILNNCSFSIHDGESVAIVGPSGGGKTTLMKLILGLLTPTSGRIYVNDRDLHQICVRSFRDSVGVVMQDDQLFAGSLAENISFFDPLPDQTLIETAAMRAAIHDEIMLMPMRYHTLVGDMGTALSGGQKQRVLLARALYRQPSMLFLDEATSHLDVEREREVSAAIKTLPLTRIIIAHRPETIASVERVVRLENGRIVETPARRGETLQGWAASGSSV